LNDYSRSLHDDFLRVVHGSNRGKLGEDEIIVRELISSNLMSNKYT
jgi:hypothetical protein